MGFRENLRDLIEYKDLTLKELSFMTGIPKGSLSNYLKENCSIPAADIAVKIADALNVSVEYLVTGINKNTAKSNSNSIYPNDIIQIAEKLNQFPKEKRNIVKNLVDDLEKLNS